MNLEYSVLCSYDSGTEKEGPRSKTSVTVLC